MRMLVPSTGTPVSPLDLARAFLPFGGVADFEREIGRWTGTGRCRMVNSGTTALFVLLRALKRLRPGREEVLLPAYTAPSLILPIRQAGLRPVLCDISLRTFNADFRRAEATARTLAVVMVPMFGLPCDPRDAVELSRASGAFLIEDAASALGSRIGVQMAGAAGDAGFLSFNRGKNLSTVSGGAVLTASEAIDQAVRSEVEALPAPNLRFLCGIRAKAIGLALVVRPLWYTLLHGAVSHFRYTTLHVGFSSHRYSAFQARLGIRLLSRAETFLTQRYKNGILLGELLSSVNGITLPQLPLEAHPVYNQFPLLLPDTPTRDAALRSVLSAGLEATTLYAEPIHRYYSDLGYDSDPDPFPSATGFSRRLLLLPTNPLASGSRLVEAAQAILKVMKAGS